VLGFVKCLALKRSFVMFVVDGTGSQEVIAHEKLEIDSRVRQADSWATK
jgi:hypothetical protein